MTKSPIFFWVSARCLVPLLLGASLLTGCSREERDFETGGPRGSIDQTPLTRDPETGFERNAYALSQGKRLYGEFNCAGCHAHGGGDIGPALMDAKWLYGAGAGDVFASIMEG